MRLMQLVYASRPFGFDELTLTEILLVARRLNKRDDITGSLICREDLYLQMLEGPRAAMTAAYARISRDGAAHRRRRAMGGRCRRTAVPRLGDARRPGPVLDVDARAG